MFQMYVIFEMIVFVEKNNKSITQTEYLQCPNQTVIILTCMSRSIACRSHKYNKNASEISKILWFAIFYVKNHKTDSEIELTVKLYTAVPLSFEADFS